jgi:hypothetical protein
MRIARLVGPGDSRPTTAPTTALALDVAPQV